MPDPDMIAAAKRSQAYLTTVDRLEPDISMIDAGAGWASLAISMKRIADVLEWMQAEVVRENEEKSR